MHDKLLNVKEVAEYLSLSEEAVKELVLKGELPAYKVGGMLIRFKKEQVEIYHKKSDAGTIRESAPVIGRPESRFAHLTGDRGAGSGRNVFRRQGEEVSYSFLERLEDFLYYNDFYILSLILLALVTFAIFQF